MFIFVERNVLKQINICLQITSRSFVLVVVYSKMYVTVPNDLWPISIFTLIAYASYLHTRWVPRFQLRFFLSKRYNSDFDPNNFFNNTKLNINKLLKSSFFITLFYNCSVVKKNRFYILSIQLLTSKSYQKRFSRYEDYPD